MRRLAESLHARHRELSAIAESVSRSAREGDWTRYRSDMTSLREGVLSLIAQENDDVLPLLDRSVARESLAPLRANHAELRAAIDVLAAASPAHDPEGCHAELERLADLLREHARASMSAFGEQVAPAPVGTATLPGAENSSPMVDLRNLDPPEPLLRILDSLDREPQKPLVALLRHEPYPLYGLLTERGRRYHGRAREDGGFELTIEPRGK